MSASALEKILRLSGGQPENEEMSADDIRVLVQAAHAALSEACGTSSPAEAAELVYAAHACVESLAATLYTEGMPDWVEATAGDPDGMQTHTISLGSSETADKPYGDVKYADPGYRGKKRYPVDTEKHVRAAWSYINQAKNAAKYTASQLSSIKGRIKSAMKSHGVGRNVEASAGEAPVLRQLLDGEATVMLAGPPPGGVPMHHAPFKGKHAHAHNVGMAHEHEHEHHDDNQHGGSVHGRNPKEKTWANEASDRGVY